MRNVSFLLMSFLVLAQCILFGQSNDSDNPIPYIEVSGSAEKKVVPDEIFVYVNLKERTENREKITVAVQEEKLLAALKSINITLDDVSLASTHSDYVRIKRKTKEVLTQKTYLVKVKDAKGLNSLFDQLDQLEIEDAGISKVSHSKLDSLIQVNNQEAIRDAKEKATYMLAAIGEKPGKPLLVVQTLNDVWNSTEVSVKDKKSNASNYYEAENVRVYGGKGAPDEISFQKIIIVSNVHTRFRIQ